MENNQSNESFLNGPRLKFSKNESYNYYCSFKQRYES